MRLRELASRFSSVSKLWGSIAPVSARPAPRPKKLRVEQLEGRELLTINIITADVLTTGILRVLNDATGEGVALAVNGANLRFTTNPNNVFIDGVDQGAKMGDIPFANVKAIDFRTNLGAFLNLTVNDIALATPLRQITYAGSNDALGETVDLSAANNPRIYYNVDMRGGVDQLTLPLQGVTVVSFSDVADANAGGLLLVPPAAPPVSTPAIPYGVAFDFRAVTTDVHVDLKLTSALLTPIANYTNYAVVLPPGTTAAAIRAVVGGAGKDVLIANDQGNLLVGGAGDDRMFGGNGADQLNATRDFSPALAGTDAGGVISHPLIGANPPTSFVDLGLFAAANASFATNNPNVFGQTGAVAAQLYQNSGFFNFGEGRAFIADGITPKSILDDFMTANGIPGPVTTDYLFGSSGTDGLYGFNNASIIAFGEGGDDVFSSNALPGASKYDGGLGTNFYFAAILTTINASQGTNDVIDVNDDASNVVIRNGSTKFIRSTSKLKLISV